MTQTIKKQQKPNTHLKYCYVHWNTAQNVVTHVDGFWKYAVGWEQQVDEYGKCVVVVVVVV